MYVHLPIFYAMAELTSVFCVACCGPALTEQTQTLLVTPGATATMLSSHVVIDVGLGERKQLSADVIDPIMVSIFNLISSSTDTDMPLSQTSVFGHRFVRFWPLLYGEYTDAVAWHRWLLLRWSVALLAGVVHLDCS